MTKTFGKHGVPGSLLVRVAELLKFVKKSAEEHAEDFLNQEYPQWESRGDSMPSQLEAPLRDPEAIPDTDEEPTRIPPRRWSRVFSRYGGLILRRIARHLGYDPPEENLLELLLAASIDPNPHRPSLIEDVRHGAFVRELAAIRSVAVFRSGERQLRVKIVR